MKGFIVWGKQILQGIYEKKGTVGNGGFVGWVGCLACRLFDDRNGTGSGRGKNSGSVTGARAFLRSDGQGLGTRLALRTECRHPLVVVAAKREELWKE